ncbi:MAG TPA: efflux RND transporter periplasmic adaptor subunit [Anaerolineales bacterium]|nr:efflux RND transporter periplasmic adaptor subunit [Anaerolineales bacterium]
MKKNHLWKITLLVMALALALSACENIALVENGAELAASGTIAARTVNIAPQLGGEVVSISVEEGQQVTAGEELFRLDDSLLAAQRRQAEAAVQLAQAALTTAQVQDTMTLNAAHLQDQQSRMSSWGTSQPDEFDLPVWYFDKEETIASASVEVEAAKADLDEQKTNLDKVIGNVASQEFLNAEKRVADAQVAFLIASQVLTQTINAQDNANLENYAQELYDAAEIELNAAQTDYNRLLTTKAAEDILEARARVEVAQERYDQALDYYNSLLTGSDSLQVDAAAAGVQQAEAALAQAQAALAAIDVQLAKTTINAPTDGVVLTLNLEVGETLAPGGVVITIGRLDEVELVVYIPETEYGRVSLDDQVSITVDSFPGETFTGAVTYISDQAEFTPRNVQTVEGRRATVYAIKLSVPNPDLKLKPGMPADVTFKIP